LHNLDPEVCRDVLKIDNLFARRSIRAFTSNPVTPTRVEMFLKVAMAAPSAANRTSWHFVVVSDAGVRTKLAAVHPNAHMVVQSPLAIVPCGSPSPGLVCASRRCVDRLRRGVYPERVVQCRHASPSNRLKWGRFAVTSSAS
jgi:nitroreductase